MGVGGGNGRTTIRLTLRRSTGILNRARALGESRAAADWLLTVAWHLATRLDGTLGALRDGIITRAKAELIVRLTQYLDDDEAQAVEAKILGRAGRLTPGSLRSALARAVMEAAPGKARERREKAARTARVERWAEDSGNAALMGRELPPDEVLACDQRIRSRAGELRKAGLEGGMDELRARAFLDLVLGKDSRPRGPWAAGTTDTAGQDGAYQRISHDKAGDEHGVGNQLADQKRLAAARGIVITRVESDNDISASNGKHRPGYEALMAAAARREIDVIIVFQTSRLWRNRRERAEGIETLRKAGVSVIATKGPSLDMSTAYGRAMAGLLGQFDTMETEVKGERQRLAAEEAAMAGKRFVGGNRPFGYEEDHVTVRPAEAAAIRWAADALLGGGAVSGVRREWNRGGLRPPQAPFGPLPEHPWTRQAVTSILRNPRIAGLAVLPQREDPDDRPELDDPPRRRKRLLPPEITGAGQWEAIVAEEQWRALTALLGDPARKPPRGAYTLLGGLARCRCGNKVAAGTNATGRQVYRCDPATRGDRPGPHCQQMTANVDPEVEKVIVERLGRDDIADLITPPASAAVDAAALRREAAAIRRNLDEMAADRALGLVSRTQMIAATERGNARLAEITADLAASASGSALAPFAAGRAAAEVWAGLDVARRRAVIGALAAVTVHPAGRGARTFDPDTVTFDPHQTPAL